MTADPRTQAIDVYQRSNLTRLQLLFWVGQRLRPDLPLFNTIHTFTIATEVDPSRFQRAFQALLDHSDAMRTVFEEEDGIPQQRVVSSFVRAADYSDLSLASDPRVAFDRWLQRRCVAPLELARCSFDVALIKIAADRYVWYMNQHHIIADAASFFLAFRYLADCYDRPAEGPMTLPALSPFAGYVDYERTYRKSSQYAQAAAYWDRKLTPRPEPVLFFGQPPVKKTSRVQRVSHDLGIDRSQRLREIAKRKEIFTVSEELSLFNVFTALFYAQLHSMSGNRRLGLLVPVHNRFTPGFKNTVGLLMEFCPLQVEVSAGDSFSSLITKVKRETRETLTHYQYGSALALQDQSFDVIFNLYQTPTLHLGGAPVEVERIHPGYGSERLALHVNDVTSSGTFVLHFDCSCDVFTEEQREQMVRHFVRLIDIFLEDNAQSVTPLDFLRTGRNTTSSREDEMKGQALLPSLPSHRLLERDVIPPRNEHERQLVKIWERVLGVAPVSVRGNFFDLGGSSWLAVRLFAEIGRVMGITLPLSTLLEAATVEELAVALRRQIVSTPWSPLVAIQSGGTKRPFFCVHGAGGHILLFDRVARHLGGDQPFFAFQARGIEQGQEPFTRIEEMAAYYVEALRKAQPDGPYLLGGYSMGGMVAFEMAQQLQAQGQKVAALAIIDVPAQNPRLRYLRQFATHLALLMRRGSEEQLQLFLSLRHYLFRLRYFSRLSACDKVAYVRGKLGSVAPNPENKIPGHDEVRPAVVTQTYEDMGTDTVLRRRIQSICALNERAYQAYIPRPYQGRVTLIRSMRGYTGDPDKDYSPDPHLGWAKVTSGDVETYVVPGDHNEIIREPQVQHLAGHLRTCLDNAQRQVNSPSMY